MLNIIDEAKRIIQEEINSLYDVKERIDERFLNAVDILIRARKIIISGVGKSGIIARKIAGTFSSIGLESYYLHPVDALHGDIGIVQEGDVVILLSKSGSTEEIVRLVPYLKSRKAKIIAIASKDSYLSLNADVFLDCSIEKEACPLNIVPTSSAVVIMALGDALALCVMQIKKITLEDFTRQHPLGQIGRNNILKVQDVMHKGKKLPLVTKDLPFKDVILEITDKNLGCCCVVDKGNKLLGIITDGDVRRTFQKFDDIRCIKAGDVMTSKPISIEPEALLGEALARMEHRSSQINVLPVVDQQNNCIGLIRLHDIIRSEI